MARFATMSAAMTKPDLPFNPDVLRWARERSGLTVFDAANKLKVPAERVHAWEIGEQKPSLPQARKLADCYDRPFLEFLAPGVPKLAEVELVPDYRKAKNVPHTPREKALLSELQRWAETQRNNALDLLDMIGEQPAPLDERLFASVSTSAELAAETARDVINFSHADQISLKAADRRLAVERLRACMSAAGILVFRRSLKAMAIRGVCLYSNILPVVIFNSGESPGGQLFTLAHELGHVTLQESGISGVDATSKDAHFVERWCNAYAAAFLMPASVLGGILAKPNFPAASISDAHLEQIANHFSVSVHAMLVRLVDLQFVEADWYWNEKRPEFLKKEKEYKSPPMRSKYHGSRYKNGMGNFYTGLVLEAWGAGQISGHNAAGLLGIKKLKHLSDIRENFPN